MSSSKTQKSKQMARPQGEAAAGASRIIVPRSSSKDDEDISGCESVDLLPKPGPRLNLPESQDEGHEESSEEEAREEASEEEVSEEPSEEEASDQASEGLTDELSKEPTRRTSGRRRKAQLLSVRKRQIRSSSGDDTQLSRQTDELDRSQEAQRDSEQFEEADQNSQAHEIHDDSDRFGESDEQNQSQQSHAGSDQSGDADDESEPSDKTEDWTGSEQVELPDDPIIDSQAAAIAASQAILQIQPTPQAIAPLTSGQFASFGTNTYVVALQKGYGALCEVLHNSMSRRKAMKQLSEETFRDVGTHVLASIPTPILREIMRDNLAYAHLGTKTPDVISVVELHQMPMVLANVPCIYQIALADERGRGLIKADLMKVLEWAFVYMKIDSKNDNDIDAAHVIDKHGHPRNKREAAVHGVRRYMPPHVEPARTATAKAAKKQQKYEAKMGLLSKKERYAVMRPSATKISTVSAFLQVLLNHASTMQANDRLLLKYVGYAVSATKRWQNHQSGNNSNYLMGLFKAICAVKLASKGYDLRKYIIVTLAEPEEAPVAELIVAELSDSYYDNGHGFNIAGAGESTSSFDSLTEQAKANAREWIRKCSPREANYNLQIQAFQARREARSTANAQLDLKLAQGKLLLQDQNNTEREHKMDAMSAVLEHEFVRLDRIEKILQSFADS